MRIKAGDQIEARKGSRLECSAPDWRERVVERYGIKAEVLDADDTSVRVRDRHCSLWVVYGDVTRVNGQPYEPTAEPAAAARKTERSSA